MAREITRAEAWDLLTKYNQEPFHLQHGETVEAVMGWYADKLGYGAEKDFWQLVGLLHDLDYEKWPEQHCHKTKEIMEGLDLDPRLIRAIISHGYGHHNDVKPEAHRPHRSRGFDPPQQAGERGEPQVPEEEV